MARTGNPRLTDFVSEENTILMPPGAVIDRGRGCYNCVHWDADKGKKHWENRRQGLLTIALQHKQDGRPEKAKGIAMMVDKTDTPVMAGMFGLCAKGWMPDDCKDSVPLIHYENLCHNWTGRDGHSLATSGHKLDMLPDELNDVYQPKPDPVIVAKAKAEAAEAAERKRLNLPVVKDGDS